MVDFSSLEGAKIKEIIDKLNEYYQEHQDERDNELLVALKKLGKEEPGSEKRKRLMGVIQSRLVILGRNKRGILKQILKEVINLEIIEKEIVKEPHLEITYGEKKDIRYFDKNNTLTLGKITFTLSRKIVNYSNIGNLIISADFKGERCGPPLVRDMVLMPGRNYYVYLPVDREYLFRFAFKIII